MRRLLAAAVTVAAASVLSASPAVATGKHPATSCGVGFAVSQATHEVGGLGRFFHEEALGNPGEAIQRAHEEVKAIC